jgi:hypothetical protein
MRILILLVQYYPVRNPNVYRWSAIAEHWVQQGHTIHVLCTRRRGEPDESVRNGIMIHRAGYATLLDWAYHVLKIQKRRGEVQLDAVEKTGFFRRFLEKIVDVTWRNFYWPDGSCLWYLPGKQRALQLQQAYHFDATVSVSLPFTANLIAQAVKKKYPAVRWLMDIEDPFAISEEFWVNNFKLYSRSNFRAEREALQLADAVSVTVAAAQRLYEQAFPKLNLQQKMRVVPPVINPHQTLQKIDFKDFIKQKIHLAYFGTFYETVRMPTAFLEIVAALFRQFPEQQWQLDIHFFGEIPQKAWAVFEKYAFLKPNLHFYGLVTRERVAAAMQETDFLLNIGNTTNYHLPSKSAEYLQSGKPIINICQNTEDTFADFMQNYSLICNLYASNDLTCNVVELNQFLKTHLGKQVSKEKIAQLVQPYTLETVADKYYHLLC